MPPALTNKKQILECLWFFNYYFAKKSNKLQIRNYVESLSQTFRLIQKFNEATKMILQKVTLKKRH